MLMLKVAAKHGYPGMRDHSLKDALAGRIIYTGIPWVRAVQHQLGSGTFLVIIIIIVIIVIMTSRVHSYTGYSW